MNTLIVGGSSGLGLAMAREFAAAGDNVIVTGRTNPKVKFAEFHQLDLATKDLSQVVDNFVKNLPDVDKLIYAAGSYPRGRVTDLTSSQIEDSISVAGRGLIYIVRSLLLKQGKIGEVVTISSIAQWTPLEKEVIYNFVKAGVGHFSSGLAEDSRVKKVLVAAPASLKNADEPGDQLSREWVAQQIIKAEKGDYKYKFIKLLRQPARVEIAEKR